MSSIYEIKIDLAFRSNKPSNLDTVQKIFSPGINMFVPGNMTNFRVICNNSFLDYNLDTRKALQFSEVILNNVSYTEMNLVDTVVLNISHNNLSKVVFDQQKQNETHYLI